jgi:hypothetical protein
VEGQKSHNRRDSQLDVHVNARVRKGRVSHVGCLEFLQVANEMGAPFNQLEMASFMTCSKGYMGECGIRGGELLIY